MYQKHLCMVFPKEVGHLEARRGTTGLSHHGLHLSNTPSLPLHVALISASLPNERKLHLSADHFYFSIRSASCDKLTAFIFNNGRSSEHVSEKAALRPVRKPARSQRMASKAESYQLFQCMQVTHTLFITTSAFRHITALFKVLILVDRSGVRNARNHATRPGVCFCNGRISKTNRAQPRPLPRKWR